jgi:hypothetical protein
VVDFEVVKVPHRPTGRNHAKLNSVEVNILIGGRKMTAVFQGLALLYMAATALAIWSSFTSSAARRRLLLTLAWIMTAFQLIGVGSLFLAAADGSTGRFARIVWFPIVITMLAPSICSIFARKKENDGENDGVMS